jgi:H+/Cl- antiporter ClcA
LHHHQRSLTFVGEELPREVDAMTLANFLVLMIAPAGALAVAGLLFWWTANETRRHGPAE